MGRRDRRRGRSSARWYLVVIAIVLLAAAALGVVYLRGSHAPTKPVILYVNQGNGAVNESNFGEMLRFAASHGFNTLFFQIYRQGDLLFSTQQLRVFVNQTHAGGLRIFFALYITDSTQSLPASVYGLGEDGVSLDMSALGLATQESYLASLQAAFHGETAVTTTDMTSPLKPDLLVLETYGSAYQQFIKPGIVAGVGVFATSGAQDYHSQFQYALQNSDGVMVFDYAGLVKAGY
ncbi:MAG TPA: hypothetical protein VLY21_05175 [Nitrososphaerales archaeon]|nr:hypothetical protein [Nitrososphaerales archaeon]